MRADSDVGVPYTKQDLAQAEADLRAQDDPSADHAALEKRYQGAHVVPGNGTPTELDALVAYLQVLGTMVHFADVNTEQLQQ